MKKLKIKGVTGTPVFLTRWRGYLDAKRRVVLADGGRWDSNYIQKLQCSCNSYIGGLYRDLEAQTFGPHQRSAELVVEYRDIKERLSTPDPRAAGKTLSMQKRSAARIAAVRPSLRRRLTEVQTALADIEEGIDRAVNEAQVTARAATALTSRKIQAYLHGAALALRKPADTNYAVAPAFDGEADYRHRHTAGDGTRKAVLAKIAKEVVGNEAVS
ncbi:MAG TPA: hypothetical protein VN446_06400 [Candidatus Acidoferrum sp.]|nr:hypothetical protein [Candidatus Acidoferrum sp.]